MRLRETSISPIHHDKVHPPKVAIPGSYTRVAYLCKRMSNRIGESLFSPNKLLTICHLVFTIYITLLTAQITETGVTFLEFYSANQYRKTTRDINYIKHKISPGVVF